MTDANKTSMEEIIVQQMSNALWVGVLENGKIAEQYEFTKEHEERVGNIYKGTIREYLKNLQVMFVEIGLAKKAFLPLKDWLPKTDEAQSAEMDEKMQSIPFIKSGDSVLVQVRKNPEGGKGARVSTHITLAGNYCVLMPQTEIITVSQKIVCTKEKERLLQIAKEILPAGYGLILRTESQGIEKEQLQKEVKELLQKWEQIVEKYQKTIVQQPKDRLLYDDNTIVPKLLRDMVKKTTKKIYINEKDIAEKIQKVLTSERVVFQEGKDFISDFGLKTDWEKKANRKIWLKCGAQIVIDKTEALTAIDVNTSKSSNLHTDVEKTILEVNKEAAVEIMRQIRLKDIGGIIVIDFINMKSTEDQEEVIKIMNQEKKKDRSKIDIQGFTKLNLVELTRKRIQQ